MLQPFDADKTECIDIPIIQDHIVEQDETFSIVLSLGDSIPGSLMGHLKINDDPFSVTIQDTSKFINYASFIDSDWL